MVIRASSLEKKSWNACRKKVESVNNMGWYAMLEDDFFMGVRCATASGKAVMHWHDLDDAIFVTGAVPGKRSVMNIRVSTSKKGFRKTLDQLLEKGMLFPLFHNSIRTINFAPDDAHPVAVTENTIGEMFTFIWDIPDLELFNPEQLEFCWIKINIADEREFLLFTEVLYKKKTAKQIITGDVQIKSWELIAR
jgi:hypothetical protein